MLCDICKKNEATIHYKEIVGGQQKSLNICAECAQKHEKETGLNFGAFNLAEMLCNLGKLAAGEPQEEKSAPPAKELACPHCGRTVKELKESGGRLGCADCYRSFAPILDGVFSRVQRGKVHVGKRPSRKRGAGGAAATAAHLAALKKELAELVKVENYEKAAQVRDAIRELEKAAEPKKKTSPETEA